MTVEEYFSYLDKKYAYISRIDQVNKIVNADDDWSDHWSGLTDEFYDIEDEPLY